MIAKSSEEVLEEKKYVQVEDKPGNEVDNAVFDKEFVMKYKIKLEREFLRGNSYAVRKEMWACITDVIEKCVQLEKLFREKS